MTRYVFKMPDLGEGTVEAEIVAWHVKVGDQVDEDQVMAEVMTEKAAVEVPAPVTGRVVSLTGSPGDMVRVGAELVVFEHTGEPVDTFILVHLKKVLEVAVGRVLTAVDHHADRAASALRQILAGGVPPDLEELLGDHLPGDGFHVAAFPAAHGARVARAAAVRRLPALVGPGRADHFALVPRAVVEELRRITEAADIPVGLSSEFTDARDALSAAAEASRVLDSARFGNRLWSEFEGTSISVLARSRREASDIVAGVLGALAEPTPAAEKLRSTLFCYLRNDRHWQATADELGIHRQTLSYRLRRIEEETGMSVTRSGDLSALWIAYQAWEDLGRAAEGETGSRSGPSGPAR